MRKPKRKSCFITTAKLHFCSLENAEPIDDFMLEWMAFTDENNENKKICVLQ